MTAKDELNAIRAEDRAIQKELERMDAWYEFATRATGSMEAERISGTGERSRVEVAVCRMIDAERDKHLTERIDRLADARREAERIIGMIEHPCQREVMRLRYLQPESWRWTWARIIKKMGRPSRTVYEWHGCALVEYERLKHKV
jgi:hypothetical protein